MRHMLELLGFSVEETAELLSLAGYIEKSRAVYAKVMEGEKLATLFYEPSTRTHLSLEAAMLNLRGSVLGFQSADTSSTSKRKSVTDTVHVASCYVDTVTMRHPKEGAPMVVSEFSHVPIINAGNGGHQHLTQTLASLMIIQSLKGGPDHMAVRLYGDLKFGRTVHSLISSLVHYLDIRFVLISPPESRTPGYIREDVFEKNRIPFTEVGSLEAFTPDPDILYMMRVQKERFSNGEDYIRLKDSYILTEEKLKNAREGMFILHPLSRTNEIAVEVDKDPRTAHFKQVQYGVYIRVVLIMELLEIKEAC